MNCGSLITKIMKCNGVVSRPHLVSNCMTSNLSTLAVQKTREDTIDVKQLKSSGNESGMSHKGFKIDRLNLSPHQYWVAEGLGMERPFTGDKWFEKDVGYYDCVVCETRLFSWD